MSEKNQDFSPWVEDDGQEGEELTLIDEDTFYDLLMEQQEQM